MSKTSEYIFNNTELNEIRNIINNTVREHNEKHQSDHGGYRIEIICDVEYLDESTNKVKLFDINCNHIMYGIGKWEIALTNGWIIIEKKRNKIVV